MGSIADNIKAYGVGQIDHENYLKSVVKDDYTDENRDAIRAKETQYYTENPTDTLTLTPTDWTPFAVCV